MVQPTRPPRNNLNRLARKLYNPLGFSKFYTFVLWFIFNGALFGSLPARAPYLNLPKYFCGPRRGQLGAAPGEYCYWNMRNQYRVGLWMHLVAIITAGFLALFQFVPVIRHKMILFHRINWYAIILLVLISHAGALMIARVSFGGSFSTKGWIGFVAMITTITLALALYNIERLRIDRHRAWMLRAWFYLCSIITEHIIQIIAVHIVTRVGN